MVVPFYGLPSLMNIILRLSFLLPLLLTKFAGPAALGQSQLGWSLDPHAGISSIVLQPAATANIPYQWDANLLSVDMMANSDYVFVSNTSALALARALRANGTSSFNRDNLLFRIGSTDYAYDYTTDTNRPHRGWISLDVMGPAASIQLGEFSRVGAFTRVRGVGSTRSIDPDLNFYRFGTRENETAFPIDEFFAGMALWSEVGINFSHAIFVGSGGEIRFGGNFRYLMGHEGSSFYNPSGGQIRKLSGDSIAIINADTEIAVSQGFLDNSFGTSITGTGFGTDLGVQYAWGYDGRGYRYTLGVSLLDVGSIHFKEGAQQHRYTNPGEVLLSSTDYPFVGDNGFASALGQLSRDAYDGDSSNSLRSTSFSLGLPTAISVQFSVRPISAVQVSMAYRGNLPLVRRLKSEQQLALVAHYSKFWYGAGFTASVYDWNSFNFGFQLRGGPFYLGTDRIRGTLRQVDELYGGSFYFGIRLHQLSKRRRTKTSNNSLLTKKSSKAIKCYKF